MNAPRDSVPSIKIPQPVPAVREPTTGESFLNGLRETIESVKRTVRPEQRWRVNYVGPAGQWQVLALTRIGNGILRLTLKTAADERAELVMHVSQCAILVASFTPKSPDEVQEEVVIPSAQK